MKRFKHSLSNYKLASFDMGELVPIGHYEVLPGDSVRQSTSCLLRVSPLMTPVMHPISVRIHHWFVPFRLLWDGWEDFITGGQDGLGDASGAFPTVGSGAGFTAGTLPDYFGLPPSIDALSVSALPFRAYNLIFNEFYRDQDLVTERVFSTASGVDVTTDLSVAKVAWEKDYFTAARPWTQRGPDVSLPLGTSAPVSGTLAAKDLAVRTAAAGGGAASSFQSDGVGNVTSPDINVNPFYIHDTQRVTSGFTADLSTATSAAINEIRRAFALQRYQEARAQYGARYTEYLRYLGVRSSDSRLQRPEYLGGGKQTISFSEVLQTAEGTDAVGTMRGHGISSLRSRRFLRYFEEHGIVVSLASVRPRSIYNDGVHRSWLRRTKEDFWQRELEQIGQQEVFNQEVYANAATPNGTFGYQDRYSEYRHLPSTVAADFRSTLNDWHLARIFAAEPVLNSAFVTCDPSKRIHAVQTEDVLWCLFNHSIQARRLIGNRTIGRAL